MVCVWRLLMADLIYIPDMTQALADLKELNALSVRWGFDLSERLRSLSDAGTPVFRANVNDVAAIGAGNRIVRYQITDELLTDLTTMRARNVHPDVINRSHPLFPPLTPTLPAEGQP